MVRLLIWGYIIAVLLFSVACYEFDHLYIIDTDHNICSKRVVINKKTLASRWVEDLPLSACDGNVSITPEEFAKIRGKR